MVLPDCRLIELLPQLSLERTFSSLTSDQRIYEVNYDICSEDRQLKYYTPSQRASAWALLNVVFKTVPQLALEGGEFPELSLPKDMEQEILRLREEWRKIHAELSSIQRSGQRRYLRNFASEHACLAFPIRRPDLRTLENEPKQENETEDVFLFQNFQRLVLEVEKNGNDVGKVWNLTDPQGLSHHLPVVVLLVVALRYLAYSPVACATMISDSYSVEVIRTDHTYFGEIELIPTLSTYEPADLALHTAFVTALQEQVDNDWIRGWR